MLLHPEKEDEEEGSSSRSRGPLYLDPGSFSIVDCRRGENASSRSTIVAIDEREEAIKRSGRALVWLRGEASRNKPAFHGFPRINGLSYSRRSLPRRYGIQCHAQCIAGQRGTGAFTVASESRCWDPSQWAGENGVCVRAGLLCARK